MIKKTYMETLDIITMSNLKDYIKMKEVELEYEMFERMFEPTALEKIDEIYNKAIKDLENLIK
jgi:hypothetical protein